MERIKDTVAGWRSMGKRLRQVIRRVNALSTVRISRSGKSDRVQITDNGVLINLRELTESEGGGVGSQVVPGILFYFSDGTRDFISMADIMSGYNPSTDDNWFLNFSVVDGELDKTSSPSGTTSTTRYDGYFFATPKQDQNFYSIPVVVTESGEKFNFDVSGVYRENIAVDPDTGPFVELIKIG